MATPTKETLESIAEQIDKAWYEGENVDTSGWTTERKKQYGLYREPVKAGVSLDDWDDGFGGVANPSKGVTKNDIENDSELWEELAQQDPSFKRQLDAYKQEQTVLEFKKSNPDYIATAENYSKIVKYIRNFQMRDPGVFEDDVQDAAYATGLWTVENLTDIFKTLLKQGVLEVAPGKPKPLTKEEQLAVIADIRMGNPDVAVIRYFQFSLGESAMNRSISVQEFMAENPELAASAVWFVFEQLHAGEYSATELSDFRKHMARFPLPTVKTLEKAFPLWQGSRRFDEIIATPQPSQPEKPKEMTLAEMNALTDDELEDKITQSKREYLRSLYA